MLVAAAALALATTRTQVVVYSPTASGVHVVAHASGYCWTSSIPSRRPDAFRCFQGNLIRDPCYATGRGYVLCPLGFPSQRVLRLRLTKPLPRKQANPPGPPTRGDPIAVRLPSGRVCGFLQGATSGIGGMRVNYGCAGGGYLVGDPARGRAWTIRFARTLRGKLTRVRLATVWY